MPAQTMEQLVSLCKRRGFIFPDSEIYGGLQGAYDYGPLGVELKNNLKQLWWRSNVYEREDMEGIDTAILMNKLVWRYSGHEETFVDPLVDCRHCKGRFRADHIKGVCPTCGSKDLTEPRPFNMMFKTAIGPLADPDSYAYLRPETAQGIFVNFKNVLDSTNRKLPFGVAQIGKAFRNEITPRNFIFRLRELEQMEIEYFVRPGDDEAAHAEWVDTRVRWWTDVVGLDPANLEQYHVPRSDLAHYSKATVDLMFRFPIGMEELEGIANRTDFDLGSHTTDQEKLGISAKVAANPDSVARLSYFDHTTNRHLVPFVIEPSAGVDRGVLAILTSAYEEQTLEKGDTRTVLHLKPALAPIKVAVLPLKKNHDGIVTMAKQIRRSLQATGEMRSVYDDTAAIGKLYRRQDEVGTPFCVTVDFQSLEDQTVTVRDRDSMQQERLAIADLLPFFRERLR
ncbi:MAG: hypothetical protein NVSMB42_24740 [Herpetosiphon sp.]